MLLDCNILLFRKDVINVKYHLKLIPIWGIILSVFFTGSSFAATIDDTTVKIKTLDGQTKELAQVNDLVRETTGTRKFIKESFLKFMRDGNDRYIFTAVKSNLKNNSVELSQTGFIYPVTRNKNHYNDSETNIHPVLGKKPDKDGSLIVMYPEVSYYAQSYTITVNFAKVDMNDKGELFYKDSGKSYTIKSDRYLTVTDAESGIFPDGEDGKEVFAITYFSASSYPGYMGSKNFRYDAHVALFDYESNNGQPHILDLGKSPNSHFPVLRIATGDFNHDNKANEFATIRSSSNNGHRYCIQAFTVDSNNNPKEYYSNWDGGCDANNFEGGDVVAGDFNGDGKTDLVAIYSYWTGKRNKDLYPLIVTYAWNGKDFHREWKGSGFEVGSQRKSYVPCFGILAEAGDINGDEHDEIVFLAATDGAGGSNLSVHVWGTDNSLKPSQTLGWKTLDIELSSYGGESGGQMASGNLLLRAFSLALVPTGETAPTRGFLRRIFFSKCEGDDNGAQSSHHIDGDRVYYMTPVFDSNGKLTDLSGYTEYAPGNAGRAMKLIPGDFYYESFELGEPEHLRVRGYNTYEITLKTPPYHVDFIKVPWLKDETGAIIEPTEPINFSYVGRTVKYSSSENQTSTNNITSTTQNSIEGGFETSVGSNLEAKIPLIGSGSAKVGLNIGASGGMTRANEHTDQYTEQRTLTTEVNTKRSDTSVASYADYHIWRYPIIKPVGYRLERNFVDNDLLKSSDTIELDGNYYMTYTLVDTTGTDFADSSHNAQYDEYDPPYEEGNIFSYPNTVEYGMENARVLTEATTFGFAEAASRTLKFGEGGSVKDGETTSWKANVTADIHCDLNASLGIEKLSGGVNASKKLYGKYAHEAATTVTSTKTWNKDESITISMPTQSVANATSNAYTVTSKVYVNEAGVLITPFSVQLGSAQLWNETVNSSGAVITEEQSPYVISCDPALLLPGRFCRDEFSAGSERYSEKWYFNTSAQAATRLRGLKIYDNVSKQYIGGALEQDWEYTLTLPIYNASMVAVPGSGVLVEYGYQVYNDTAKRWDSRVKIGEQRIALGGWTNDKAMDKGGSNKGEVKFNWTPKSEEVPQGRYRFYFLLDPNNEIKEIHENYTDDPAEIDAVNNQAGNNIGYREFSIIHTDFNGTSSSVFAADTTNVTSRDFELVLWDVNDPDNKMTAKEFREYVFSKNESVQVGGIVSYVGAATLRELDIAVRCKNSGSNTAKLISRRRIYGVRPNESREFYFTVNRDALEGRTFEVSFSGNKGEFPIGGGTDLDPDNNDDDDTEYDENGNALGSSSGGCNTGFASVSLGIFTALLVISSRKIRMR